MARQKRRPPLKGSRKRHPGPVICFPELAKAGGRLGSSFSLTLYLARAATGAKGVFPGPSWEVG